jgi:hypothetical protein
MLVRYARAPGLRTGVETIVQRYHCPAPNGRAATRFHTTWSCAPLTAGRPTTYAQVIVPLDPAGLPPAQAAAGVRVSHDADGVTRAELTTPARVTVTLGPQAWEARR